MKKMTQKLLIVSMILLSTPAFATPSFDVMSMTSSLKQYAEEFMAKNFAKNTREKLNNDLKNYKNSSSNKKEKNETGAALLTYKDLAPYTDSTFSHEIKAELESESPSPAKLQALIKNAYLIDPTRRGGLISEDPLDSDGEITVDPMKDAATENTNEYIAHKRYLAIHNAIALGEKAHNSTQNQEAEIQKIVQSVKAKKDLISLERSVATLNQKIGHVLNELLAVEGSRLELNSSLFMQYKQKNAITQ